MARVTAIHLFPEKGGPALSVDAADAAAGGLVGDQKRGRKRQVTVLGLEGWQAAAAGAGVPGLAPALRRANVVVEGLDLPALIGHQLRLGEAVLQVLGVTEPCGLMDRAQPGLRAAMEADGRGGVYGAVVTPGRIRVGDEARQEPDAPLSQAAPPAVASRSGGR